MTRGVPRQEREVTHRERRRERHQHENDEASSPDLRQHRPDVATLGNQQERRHVGRITRAPAMKELGEMPGIPTDRSARLSDILVACDICHDIFAVCSPPLHQSCRRPIRCHTHLMRAARAIPAATALGAACGSKRAPVKRHAPRKNSQFIRVRPTQTGNPYDTFARPATFKDLAAPPVRMVIESGTEMRAFGQHSRWRGRRSQGGPATREEQHVQKCPQHHSRRRICRPRSSDKRRRRCSWRLHRRKLGPAAHFFR